MVKAIVFDCFGVLTTEGWLAFKDKYFGHDRVLFQEASDLIKKANSGLISDQDFINQTAKMAGLSQSEVYAALRQNVPNEALFDYIKELKANYKVGILSNVAGDYLHKLFSKQQLDLFDAIALSFETGVIKPNARAYEAIADQLGATPAEVVFVDDQQKYVEGAVQVGMQAICYQDFGQFKSELEAILANSKS